jgi:hypothetical protein
VCVSVVWFETPQHFIPVDHFLIASENARPGLLAVFSVSIHLGGTFSVIYGSKWKKLTSVQTECVATLLSIMHLKFVIAHSPHTQLCIVDVMWHSRLTSHADFYTSSVKYIDKNRIPNDTPKEINYQPIASYCT